MKIAFDEHVPPAMARVFQGFSQERRLKELISGLTIESARDYAPKPGDPDHSPRNDAPWIRRFSQSGGKVIISGNTKMRRVPHERLALVEENLITIFFENQWSRWKFHRKCALLMHWWPAVVTTIKSAKPGSFWCIPCNWVEDGSIRAVPNEDARLVRIERQLAERRMKQSARRAKRVIEDQGDLFTAEERRG